MDLALCKTITTQGPCKRESTEALRCKKHAKHSRKAIWTATSLPFCLSFRTDPYSRTRFSCLIQRYIYKACTDMYRCKHLDKFNVLIPCIFFYDLNTTPFWTRPTCPSGSFQSKSRWGPDEDRRYCLYVATSETNSFNNWSSEKLLVMFSLNFELLIVSSSAWRRVSGRGEKA